MIKARLAIEIYRHFIKFLPPQIRFRLKHYIDKQRDEWHQIGILNARLNETPYNLLLDMKHWHQRWTYIKGHYPEPHVTGILDTHLGEGGLFVDIGANIGVHTVYAAHKVGRTGQCIAFEPNPHSYKRLSQQIALNQLENVTVHHTALGNDVGTVVLQGCNDENVGSSLRTSKADDDGCEVPLNPADNYLADIPQQQQGICKIDVEGYEHQVLLGLVGFIASHPNMSYIVEVTDEWLKASGSSSNILFEFFREHNFHPHYIDPVNASLRALDNALPDRQYDVLFKQ